MHVLNNIRVIYSFEMYTLNFKIMIQVFSTLVSITVKLYSRLKLKNQIFYIIISLKNSYKI
jgi:hypothetical protein